MRKLNISQRKLRASQIRTNLQLGIGWRSNMKLNSDADIERIAKAIEKDAGHHIGSIRDALKDVRDNNTGQVHSREQLLVRAARVKHACRNQHLLPLLIFL